MRVYKQEYKKRKPGYWKGWKKRPAEKSRELQKAWRQKNPERAMFIEAKCRAKARGIPFTITFEDIHWPVICPVFGTPLVYGAGKVGRNGHRANSASLDRKVNELGYVPGNVFVISHRANRLKSDITREELENLYSYVTAPVTSAKPQCPP